MGWNSGSQLAEQMYDEIRELIPKTRRQRVAEAIIANFEHHDADDWSEDSELWLDSGRPVYDPADDGDCW